MSALSYADVSSVGSGGCGAALISCTDDEVQKISSLRRASP